MERKIYWTLVVISSFILSCGSNDSNTITNQADNMRLNLIDGNWEINYILNTPGTLDELYPRSKPNITFDSGEGKVAGLTGCNNFTGNFSMDGQQISIDSNLAVTRKMCPDMTGEDLFLETLKKINSYSVSEQGNTLNLIMGDMAIMRCTRK